ncbi:MarR family transcriptional regulator [Dactylosporangium sp. NPDC051485]|uniref:MarR family transcriptional regulator n=1 Tax=Dactylosporangium sp. NPDC051485 TaxID=3154846 RepID=UPI0034275D62
MTEAADGVPPRLSDGGAIVALCRTATVIRAHLEREALRPRRLTWTAFEVLRLAVKYPRIRLHELARLTGASKGTIISAVRQLEERRLIVRQTPQDLRQVELVATGDGRHSVNEVVLKVIDIEARLMPDPQLRRAVAAIAQHLYHPPAPPDRSSAISGPETQPPTGDNARRV